MRTRPDGDRDRGQLLLIAGLGIAVAFVALALVVNSAVFAQTLSTRPGPDGAAAVQYQQEATQGVGGIVSEANAHDYVSAGSLVGTVDRSAVDWNGLTASEYGAHETLTNASVVGTVNGTGIHQATPRAFTDRNGSADWWLFSHANGVRRFRMNVTATGLATNRSRALTLDVSYRDHANRTVTVYRNGSRVVVANATATRTAPAPGATTVDFSNASLGTAHAPVLDVRSVGTVTGVHVSHGDNATGRYVALVNATPGNLYGPDNGSAAHYYTADGASPSALHAVYAVQVNVSYHSPRITYHSTVTVAPGSTPKTGRVGAGSARYGVVPLQDRVVFSYANGDKNLSTIDALGGVTRYRPANPQVIGPRTYDLTGDGIRDIPYVNQSGDLLLTNRTGKSTVLATNAYSSASLLAVGFWNGTGPSVFYAGNNKKYVYRVRPGHNATRVVYDSNEVTAVAGIGDVDGDGQDELLFSSGSQQLYVYQPGGGTPTKVTNGGTASSSGIGASPPADFNGNGVERVPHVTGSNNLNLLTVGTGHDPTLVGGAAKAPVRPFDIDGDGKLEIVYLNQDGQIRYVDNVTTTPVSKPLTTVNGTAINASKLTGVA